MRPQLLASQTAARLARNHFYLFVSLAFRVLEPGTKFDPAWYLDAMAAALMDVERGDCQRLMITIPPRHLKSLIASIMFPAWVLGRDPTQKFICVSYSQDLADTHARNFRRLVQSKFFGRIFPVAAASFVRNVESDLHTRQGGCRRATSLGGTFTGIGADYILIDDLMKAQEANLPEARRRARQFVDETLLSRLNHKATGRIVSIQQRLHPDDIVAHLKEKGGFRELELAAIAQRDQVVPLTRGRFHTRKMGEVLNPTREPQEVLERIRKEMGNRAFQAQYQQNPEAAGTAYVVWEKLTRYQVAPQREELKWVIQSWDTAASEEPGADFSVGTTWGYDGKGWLLLDVIRERLTYSDLLARVRLARKLWLADEILVENASVGLGLYKELWYDWQCKSARAEHHAAGCEPTKIVPLMSKTDRMTTQVERLYEGFAKIPRDAPWLGALHEEMRSFPGGRHDDQVDSISQFLNYAVRLNPRFFVKGARVPSERRPGLPRHAR